MKLGPHLNTLLLSLALCLACEAARAAPDYAGQIARQLAGQGYSQIEVRRSLLGKLIVTGTRPGLKREIVIDPRNGELLRDLVRRSSGNPIAAEPVLSSSGDGRGDGKSDDHSNGGGNSGSDDDSDDDSGSDDNSGGSDDDSGSDDGSDSGGDDGSDSGSDDGGDSDGGDSSDGDGGGHGGGDD